MSQRTGMQRRTWKERALSLLLAAALVAGLAPGLTLPASAAHWADAYLDQLVDWGVLRADQTTAPDSPLTRAEFMAVINRAYGYTETGPIPFTDVFPTDWFYDDISIAYTAGYMQGTSDVTASPNDTLTREQAFCILGRNMMMKETPGENLAFADSREVSDWARGIIKTAVDHYIISGYPDNTLRPQASISKGQMAALVTQCIGTPVQQSGTYELGGVFGNVTITAPNVTLRNTTISGDLYVSGGVGLGGIKLENVDVLGRIIVSGTGESEGGAASVIMRNVTAEEMLVDNMRNKTVTVRADGITKIAKTVVRTNAYLEDNNTDEEGLLYIELDGDPGLRLTLAGRIKEVMDKTPSSFIQVAKGTVAKLTVDEAATGSTVQIDRNTKVMELNLDVATSVIGDGDIGQLNINAPGSVVTMLPDKIYIRPGLTASIAGVIMDYQAAEEGSLDPRLLSGYPAAKDISPTGFRADFAANKKGTIYWAVSYVSDGSIGEDDLISPPSYGSKAIANGSVTAPAGGDEVSAQVGSLVVGGSYYLSAIVVDSQKNRSPVKVISFSTPDNTVPAFGQGYPYMSRTTRSVAQVTVMPTKSCKLYYALLPQGAKAPTANEMKAAAVTGNLGYGVRDVTKNTEEVFTVNSQRLEELKTYVLYLWLTDVDGANSSAVRALTFTIPDETPPVVDPVPYALAQGTTGNTIAMRTGMNERGTIFWAAVPHGENYPLPNMTEPLGPDNVVVNGEPVSAKLDSMYAKLGVQGGRGALVRGSVVVNNPDAEVSFNVTGLLPETAYDLYYVGRDSAGNYSEAVRMVTVNTLDTSGPIVTLYFINPDGSTTDASGMPPANASIVLDFSELITVDSSTNLLDLDEQLRIDRLQENFVLHQLDPMNPAHEWNPIDVTGEGSNKDALKDQAIRDGRGWIDYDRVIVRESSTEQGHIEVVFPYNSNGSGAVSMMSGRTYFFTIAGVRDTSGNYPPGPNNTVIKVRLRYDNVGTVHTLPRFTTAFASVSLNGTGYLPYPVWAKSYGAKDQAKEGIAERTASDGVTKYQPTRMDTFFTVTPESTEGITDGTFYDIVLFADQSVNYDLYYRIVDTTRNNTPITPSSPGGYVVVNDTTVSQFEYYKLPSSNTPVTGEENGWIYLGNCESTWDRGTGKAVSAVNSSAIKVERNYPQLNRLGEGLRYDFAISVTSKNGDDRYKAWNGTVNFDVYVMAGSDVNLYNAINGRVGPGEYTSTFNLQSVGIPNPPGYVTVFALFSDSIQPVFREGYPILGELVTSATLEFALNPTGSTLYYRIAPVDNPISATLEVYNGGGGVTTGTKVTAAKGKNTPFYDVIKAQTDLMLTEEANAGQLEGVSDTDEGHLHFYKVTEESGITRNDIANMNNSYPSNWPGSEKYNLSAGSETVSVPGADSVKQLLPNTDYYIYIVLESASGNQASLSQIYIYTFRTDDTAKPKFTQLYDTTEGTFAASTNVLSKMSYIMISQTDLSKVSILNKTFAPANLPSAYSSVNTVLKALQTPYSHTAVGANAEFGEDYDSYTIFDLYASDDDKYEVDRMVREALGLSGSVVPVKLEKDLNAGSIDYYDWFTNNSNASPDPAEYVLVVAAHNRDSTVTDEEYMYTIDSFRALSGVHKTDLTPPVLTGLTASIRYHGNTRSGTYDVNLEVIFNKNLYYKNGNATPFVRSLAQLSNMGTFFNGTITTSDPASAARPDHRVSLTNVNPGGTLTIPSTYSFCDSSGSGITTNKIKVSVSEVSSGNGGLVDTKIGRVDVEWGTKGTPEYRHWAWTENGVVPNPDL